MKPQALTTRDRIHFTVKPTEEFCIIAHNFWLGQNKNNTQITYNGGDYDELYLEEMNEDSPHLRSSPLAMRYALQHPYYPINSSPVFN